MSSRAASVRAHCRAPIPHQVASVATLAALFVAAGCQLGDGARSVELTPSLVAVVDSSVVGTQRDHDWAIDFSVEGEAGEVDFIVTTALGSSWLQLPYPVGSAPGPYGFRITPDGLAAGEYVDTLRFSSTDPEVQPLRVPVRFKMLPFPVGSLSVTPGEARDSIRLGKTTPITFSFNVTHEGVDPEAAFYVRAKHQTGWLTFANDADSGRTPGAFTITFHPAGRPAGAYVDTLTFLMAGPSVPEVRVPLHFAITNCPVIDVGAIPAVITSALTQEDCTGTVFTGRYAKRFRVQGTAGDSVFVKYRTNLPGPTSNYGASLSIELEGAAAPLATTNVCTMPVAASCFRYFVLPQSAAYIVETSSWVAGSYGAFELSITKPRPPDPVVDLAQWTTTLPDGPLAVGSTWNRPTLAFVGYVSDPDLDSLRMEVEVRAVGTPYTGAPNVIAPYAAGSRRQELLNGLVAGTSYKWRARAVDHTGRAGPWTEFGGNGPEDPDFTVVAPPPGS